MRWWIPVSKICKFLSWTTEIDGITYQRGLYRLIADREMNEPYLHRYYIFSTRWLKRWFPKLSYRLVLHKCVRSDADGLHDHPWDWKSKILEGGYWEHLPKDRALYRDPHEGWRSSRATDFHRLVLPRGASHSWSLFLMGPKTKDWGFLDKNDNWIQWQEYIHNRHLYI